MASTSSDTVILARFFSRHEGEIAQGFLLNANIPAALFTDDAGGMEPQLAFVRPARLVVRREHVDAAVEVLEGAGVEVEVGSDPS